MSRAVLVVQELTEMPRRYDLDAAESMGVVIDAVVDMEHVRQAHQLVADGEVDVIVCRGDLPTVRRLTLSAHTEVSDGTVGNPRLRRPQVVGERTQYVRRAVG